MARVPETYDASARASEMIPKEVIVGGKTFRVKRTGSVLKQIIELAPDEEGEDDSIDNAADNVDILYDSIRLLLVDQESNHPELAFLMDELDFEVAQELMAKFLPNRQENPPTASAEASSTTT